MLPSAVFIVPAATSAVIVNVFEVQTALYSIVKVVPDEVVRCKNALLDVVKPVIVIATVPAVKVVTPVLPPVPSTIPILLASPNDVIGNVTVPVNVGLALAA